jgi:hypothetical protein
VEIQSPEDDPSPRTTRAALSAAARPHRRRSCAASPTSSELGELRPNPPLSFALDSRAHRPPRGPCMPRSGEARRRTHVPSPSVPCRGPRNVRHGTLGMPDPKPARFDPGIASSANPGESRAAEPPSPPSPVKTCPVLSPGAPLSEFASEAPPWEPRPRRAAPPQTLARILSRWIKIVRPENKPA